MEFLLREIHGVCLENVLLVLNFDSLGKTCMKTNYILTNFIHELSDTTSVTEYCY